ncbi:ObirOr5-U35 [Ooceraea biroi]|uniref:Odorant receptor n=1 Tax=Ooceraea biroi TaxID=2015173 RepID=A0A3L8DJK3_OOCBI|nr:odorant receptor Or2-like isoform X2 [Ooceraea biroi]RLU20343.1 ObirOr5-U35 [Ooceraea biroi]
MNNSNSSEQKDFKWAVKLNRISLEFVGLWPELKQNFREKLLCNLRTFFAVIIVTIGALVPSIHSLIRIHSNIVLTIDNLQFTLPILSVVIKLIIFWWKKETLIPIVDMIAKDWLKPKSVRERNTMVIWALRARIIIICSYVSMAVAYIIFITMPIFGKSMRLITNITDPGRPMLLQSYYIYDVTKRPQFELTFISQAFSTFVAVLPYTGIDNFLGLLTFHICGQLVILKNRFIHLHDYKDFHEILKDCVTYHIRLLRAIDVIENVYNMILLVLFLYFGILFAFYGFLLISLFQDKEDDVSMTRLLYLIVIIMVLFAHMCLYCAVGEMLMAQCNEIHFATYNHEWYFLDSKEAKNLIPFMIRASQPIHFTAGKVFPMTMATFCNLIKTSAGYISVLFTGN